MKILYLDDRGEYLCIHMGVKGTQTKQLRCRSYLDQLCRAYGSTYQGRRDAACSFLHIKQKVPIMVCEEICLFPAITETTQHHVWINYAEIRELEAHENQTRFIFHDGTELLADMEYRSALRQIRRCSHYLYAMSWNHHQPLANQIFS